MILARRGGQGVVAFVRATNDRSLVWLKGEGSTFGKMWVTTYLGKAAARHVSTGKMYKYLILGLCIYVFTFVFGSRFVSFGYTLFLPTKTCFHGIGDVCF